ncbi:MAG: outer membrane protein assembly factor BamD [Pseudomonadota bacterium]
MVSCGVLRSWLTLLFLLGLLLSACATTLLRGAAQNAQQAYDVAMEDLDDGLFPEAIAGFSEVKAKYPYSQYVALADLRIADMHFARGKFIEAIDAYRVFLKLHPSHAEAAYAMFRIAEANFEQIPEDWWFLPPSAEKDQGNTRLAISAYRDLVARFPNLEHSDKGKARLATCREKIETPVADTNDVERESCRVALAQQQLIVDAVARLDECRRKLADHEIYVARFYFGRRQYVAAATRADALLRDYTGLGLDAAALLLSARSRLQLGEDQVARENLQRLTKDFSDAEEAEDAQELLRQLGVESAAVVPPQVQGT